MSTAAAVTNDRALPHITGDRKMLVGGDWVDSASGETFPVYDPTSGEVIAQAQAGGAEDVDRAVAAARKAFDEGPWTGLTPYERARRIERLADLIEENAQAFAEIDSLDTGKPIGEMHYFDIPFSLHMLRYFSGWTTKIHGETIPISYPVAQEGQRFHAYTVREPIGVVGQIIPWNFPLMMAIKKMAPALTAGCTMVLKPAEQTPLSVSLLGELVLEADIPEGVFNFVTGLGETAGAALASHPDVDKIAFTGSSEVGKLIVKAAAGNLKRVSLELGGKSPNIVFDDANLAKAVTNASIAIFGNQGESCIAGSRLYVQKPVFDEVVGAIADRAKTMKVGPGLDPTSEMGPLVSQEHLERVTGYLESGVAEGAEALVGGERIGDRGYFVEPTVMVNAGAEMRITREEIFGPVLTAIPFETEEEVVAAANDSPFGLGAAVWTNDLSRAHTMAAQIKSGHVWLNCYQATDAALPFGGYKQSGWGRETCRENVEDYTEVKTVVAEL